MKCQIAGCDQETRYKARKVCQKHYFRFRRNGSYDLLPRTRQYRVEMPGKGYQRLYEPSHALTDSQGYVSENRKVIFDIYGWALPDCEICGKPTSWKTCHIDHIDENVKNNNSNNLRPLCPGCNTWRSMPPLHTFDRNSAITFDGKTETAEGWSRDPRVKIWGGTITRRKNAGMSDFDALFSKKVTHNGKLNTKKPTPAKHTRKNAIRITIDGQMMTAAEWSRHPGCPVTENTIISRIRAGWEHRTAVFNPAKVKASPSSQLEAAT